jgi:hypothetical protein
MPKKSNDQIFEEAEAELYGEAIKQTEQEIYDDALGLSPDENDGDTSLEQMDNDDAPTGDEEPTDEEEGEKPDESEEGEGEGEEGEGKEPEAGDRQPERGQDRRGIPPGRLREESEARRVAEAERDAERARVRELDARLRLLEQGDKPKPQQPERPDMFADPEGWAASQRAEIEASVAVRHVNASLNDTAEEHGERFHEAYTALIRAGQSGDRQTVQQIWDSPNPGRALMRWHDRQQLIRDVGTDPQAYRTRVARELMQDSEFRQQMLETMRNDAMNGDGGRPRTRTRLPASLNGASGGAGHRSRDPGPTRGGGFSASAEREIADSVWEN